MRHGGRQPRLKRQLRSFWNSTCRTAIGVASPREIPTVEVHRRLRVRDVTEYLRQRRLAWAGRLGRMPFARIPRRLLTAVHDNRNEPSEIRESAEVEADQSVVVPEQTSADEAEYNQPCHVIRARNG